jgi:hypothetical protein
MTKPGRRPLLFLMRGLDPVGTGRQVELAAEACRAAGHEVVQAGGDRRRRRTGPGDDVGRCLNGGLRQRAAAALPGHREEISGMLDPESNPG